MPPDLSAIPDAALLAELARRKAEREKVDAERRAAMSVRVRCSGCGGSGRTDVVQGGVWMGDGPCWSCGGTGTIIAEKVS